MSNAVNLKLRGLYTFPNLLSSIPEGALVEALNVVIDRDNVVEPRRGFGQYTTEFNSGLNQLFTYKNRILAHYGTKIAFDSDGLGTFVNFDGDYTSPTDFRIKSFEQNGNFYFNTDEGVKKISATAASDFSSGAGYIQDAGVAKALNIKGTVVESLNQFLLNGYSTAYKLVWGYYDTNNVLNLGAPSSRLVVSNSVTPSTALITNYTASDPSTVTSVGHGLTTGSKVIISGTGGDIDGEKSITFIDVDNFTVENTSGNSGTAGNWLYEPAALVEVDFSVPEEIKNASNNTSFFYRLYRTPSTTTTPQEEYNLVFEDFYDGVSDTITIEDIYPESLRQFGGLLYTNLVSGEGDLQANEKPPLCQDMDVFKNTTFYSNTSTRHKFTLTMIDGDADLNNKSLTITTVENGTPTSETYTFKLTPTDPDYDVQISNLGIADLDIEITALNFVDKVNANTNESVYAYYTSNSTTTPGIIDFEARALDIDYFYFTVSDTDIGERFNPTLPTSGESIKSDNQVKPNRLFYSKFQQPEAVPLPNFIDIGPRDKAIQRIVALRDSLFIFKEDGIYRLTGTNGSYAVAPFDSSAKLLAPDSAVVLNNQVYAFSTQGIITVTDTGVSVISRAIENKLLSIIRPGFDYEIQTFGVSYETDRAYLLWTVENDTDTVPTQCFRYNTFTNTWTRWDISKTCGIVNSFDDKLYLGTDDNFIEQERKNRDRTDYADRSVALAIIEEPIENGELKISSISDIEVGDALVQEQYVTISGFNRLLRKLDNDSQIVYSGSGFEADFSLAPGNNLHTTLIQLIASLNNDTNLTGTYIPPVSNSITDIRDAYNAMLVELDGDGNVFYTKFNENFEVTEITTHEASILAIESTGNVLTIGAEPPFLSGDVVAYTAFETRITWAPQTMGDVSLHKQVSEATFIFEDNNFTQATVGFSTDLSPSFAEIDFDGSGTGDFGSFTWGGQFWGGISNAKPLRTYIPLQKQRCRFINARFEHKFAYEKYSLFGGSITFRPYSNRAYK